MRATFKLGKAKHDTEYVPYVGEVLLREEIDGRIITLVGDGKTAAKDLLPFISHDIHTRVSILEEEIKELKNKLNDFDNNNE